MGNFTAKIIRSVCRWRFVRSRCNYIFDRGIAICRLLEPYGYYEFEYFDEDSWPHYKIMGALPTLKAGEQSVLMKEAIANYFLESGYIE
jgi:hypothetical protein